MAKRHDSKSDCQRKMARKAQFEALEARVYLSGNDPDELLKAALAAAPVDSPASEFSSVASADVAAESAPGPTETPISVAFAKIVPLGSPSAADAAVLAANPWAGVENPLAGTQDPNAPIGEAKGVEPGRVAWVRDTAATSWDGISNYWWNDTYTDKAKVAAMLDQAVRWVGGTDTAAAAWDRMFRDFNLTRGLGDVGYSAGERIVIKANLNENDNQTTQDNFADVTPALVYSILHQLIEVAGVPAADIYMYDSLKAWPDKIYNYCNANPNFVGVHYVDNAVKSGNNGREAVKAASDPSDMMYWSTGAGADALPSVVVDSKYMVNLSIAKKHDKAGITGSGKNHFGSFMVTPTQTCAQTQVLHDYLPNMATQMNEYRPFVDLLGHKDLGGKTILNIMDGIYGGWDWGSGTSVPTKYVTLGNDWLSSLFVSQDPIALDSVLYDFITTEHEAWQDQTGMNRGPDIQLFAVAEDYLHQAALCGTPGARVYTPSGTPLQSLGVHEHWNNAVDREYSRDLHTGNGIELVRSDPSKAEAVITSPVAESKYSVGTNVTIAANAFSSRNGGPAVTKVVFYQNGTLIGEDAVGSNGWSLDWTPPGAGQYRITARAFAGEEGLDSNPVDIYVGAVVSIAATDPTASEWKSGSEAQGVFTFERSGPTTSALAFNYSVSGTATNGSDYTLVGTAAFAIGQSQAQIVVQPINAGGTEGVETVVLTLTGGSYGIGLANQATVNIVEQRSGNSAPVIRLFTPATSLTPSGGENVVYRAWAYDVKEGTAATYDQYVSTVEFIDAVTNQVVFCDTAGPFEFAYSGTPQGVYARVTDPDGEITYSNRATAQIFYNNSAWDGKTPGAAPCDSDAIAPDKVALLPTKKAAYANYTNYSKGINGVIVDLTGPVGTITAADFTFRVGNDNTPSAWADAPAPTVVSQASPVGGVTRVTLIWADGAIKNQWLMIGVKANTNTGLAAQEVFYFGNAIGETGNHEIQYVDAVVNSEDETRTKRARTGADVADLLSRYDFNRDKRVSAADELIARANKGGTALGLITPAGVVLGAGAASSGSLTPVEAPLVATIDTTSPLAVTIDTGAPLGTVIPLSSVSSTPATAPAAKPVSAESHNAAVWWAFEDWLSENGPRKDGRLRFRLLAHRGPARMVDPSAE